MRESKFLFNIFDPKSFSLGISFSNAVKMLENYALVSNTLSAAVASRKLNKDSNIYKWESWAGIENFF